MYLPKSTAIKLIAYTIGDNLSRAEKARYDYYMREYSSLVARSNSGHHAAAAQVSDALGTGDRLRIVAALTIAAALPAIPTAAQIEELPDQAR
jgi:hypothetical protein